MNNRSFSSRLSWRIIRVVSAVFLVAFVTIAVVSHRIIADEASRSTQYILHGTISDIEKPLNEVEIATQTVGAYMTSMMDRPQMLQLIASRTVELNDLIVGCAVIFVNPDGSCNPERTPVFSFLDGAAGREFHPDAQQTEEIAAQWVPEAVRSKNGFWTAPSPAAYNPAVKIVTYCFPLVDSALNVFAVVATDLPIAWMQQKVEELRPCTNAVTTLIFNKDNIVGIKESDSNLIARLKKSFARDESFNALTEDLVQNKDSIRRRVGKGRDVSFVVYGPLHNGWKISILCPYRDVLRRSSQMHINLLVIGIIGLVVLFFVCRRVIRRMTRPITELSVSALNMAKGNFKAKLPEITSQDEMLRLHDSFIYMQNSIADYIEQLKTTTSANERMESELNVARNIQMGMLRTDFPRNLHALLIPAKEVGGDLYDFTLKVLRHRRCVGQGSTGLADDGHHQSHSPLRGRVGAAHVRNGQPYQQQRQRHQQQQHVRDPLCRPHRPQDRPDGLLQRRPQPLDRRPARRRTLLPQGQSQPRRRTHRGLPLRGRERRS